MEKTLIWCLSMRMNLRKNNNQNPITLKIKRSTPSLREKNRNKRKGQLIEILIK